MPESLAARRTESRPLLSDYLTDAEMDRLAEVLIGLLVATERARIEAAGPHTPEPLGARAASPGREPPTTPAPIDRRTDGARPS